MAKQKTQTRKRRERLTRHVEIRAESIRKEQREVDVSFSSQTEEVRSWTGVSEVLLHEPGSVDLERLERSGSVLFNHHADSIVGRPKNVKLDTGDRVGRATVVFDDDPTAEGVFRKVLSGSLRGVSVGFEVEAWRSLRANEKWTSPGGQEFSGPLEIAERWKVFEISLTPIPADAAVGVGRSEEGAEALESEEQMAKETTPAEGATQATVPASPPAAPVVDIASERARGASEERARVAQIRQIVGCFPDLPEVAKLEASLVETGATPDQARAQVFDLVAQSRKPVTTPGKAGIELQVEERAKIFDASVAWLNDRVGKLREKNPTRKEELRTSARQLGCYSLLDLARECLRRNGIAIVGTRDQLITRAFSHSSSDFPNILEAAANKVLLAHWEEAPNTYEPLVKKVSAPDFKAMPRYTLGDAGLLEKVPEGGKMPEGTVPEAKTSYAIATYAKRFGITRQAIINDDMQALDQIPALHGTAARQTVNQLFWQLLTSASGVGPTMGEDATALFSASHASGSNYDATTGTPDNVTHLGRAKQKMRLQKGLVGSGESARALNIVPKFIVLPAALEISAAQFLASIVDPSKNNATPNPFAGSLQAIVEPYLDGATNGTTAWYLAADPNTFPGAEAAFLDGREEPTLVQVEGTNILGVEWGIYLDVGFAFVGHRGWYRCRGA